MQPGFETERRVNTRVFLRSTVLCELTDPVSRISHSKTAICQNVSPNGLYFEIDELVALRSEINIKFQLPRSNKMTSATIMVVRIESLAKDVFGVGARFTHIAEEDKEDIGKYVERSNINNFLKLTIDKGASDLHLLAEYSPVMRINGELRPLEGEALHAEDIRQLVFSLMSKEQVRAFEKKREIDFGIQFDISNRFRVNVHQQRGFTEAALRLIATKTFSFEELRIPDIVQDLARQRDGLIIITGPTGSGKTTTIAAMVDLINRERRVVIITLERPIEYMHKNIKSIVKQREIGVDTDSFSDALKSSLRQDPNVIVVGEMDDYETIKTAIIAAEAGYLVVATFHAPDSIQAIDRLISMFPAENRRQMLSQLSNCLKGIIAQVLIPRRDRKGRVLATEVLMATDAVKRIIRKDELFQLATVMQTGVSSKMQLMQDAIRRYLEDNTIDTETAVFYSQEFARYI
ncbi:MAG: PilT/PilU family type 4a pilus ATPase [Candidatus Omnitrophota bacterium]|nr:PilT/PilU family type 4a pilus ATPase [Candidatus Omnitrophota bacterium]